MFSRSRVRPTYRSVSAQPLTYTRPEGGEGRDASCWRGGEVEEKAEVISRRGRTRREADAPTTPRERLKRELAS